MSRNHNNAVSRLFLEQVFSASEHVYCEYCGKEIFKNVPMSARNRAVGDHRIPISRGGPDDPINIAISCWKCDHEKSHLTGDEYLSVRGDSKAVYNLKMKVLVDLGIISESKVKRNAARKIRKAYRHATLMQRLKIPNPECVICLGTGRSKINTAKDVFCPCSILPKELE